MKNSKKNKKVYAACFAVVLIAIVVTAGWYCISGSSLAKSNKEKGVKSSYKWTSAESEPILPTNLDDILSSKQEKKDIRNFLRDYKELPKSKQDSNAVQLPKNLDDIIGSEQKKAESQGNLN